MSHSLNSLKGGCIGDFIRDYYIGVAAGNAGSLDYSSHELVLVLALVEDPSQGPSWRFRV